MLLGALLIPHQFSKNLYMSLPFWMIVFCAIVVMPLAFLQTRQKDNNVILYFFVYIIVTLITTVHSSDFARSSQILLLNFSYFLIFLGSGAAFYSLGQRKKFINLFVFVVFILGMISSYSFIKGYINLTQEGISFMWGYFGHNHISVLLIVGIPLLIYCLWVSPKLIRIVGLLVLLFFLHTLLISFSRSAILAIMTSLILGTVVFFQVKKGINFKAVFFLGAIFVVLIFFSVLIMERKSLRTVQTRLSEYQSAVDLFTQRPFVGFGPGTYAHVNIKSDSPAQRSFFAHNLLIQTLVEGGVLLFSSTIFLYCSLFVHITKSIQEIAAKKEKYFYVALWVGLVAVFTNEMMDFDLQLPSVGGIFWLIAGICVFRKQGVRSIVDFYN